jgi:HD-like signal output (HDOD) protein
MAEAVLSCIAQVRGTLGAGAAPLVTVLERAAANGELALPPIPTTVHQICQQVEAPRCDLLRFAQTIAADPALAERVVTVANSSFFAGHDRVHTVRDAVVRMGIRETRNVVVGIALRSIFWGAADFENSLIPLWQHSLATAAAAQGILCEVCFDDNAGFLTGLTHDVGRVAVLQALARMPELPELRRTVPLPLAERLIDAVHAEIGAHVLQSWGFPSSLVRAVRHHHSPEQLDGPERAIALALQAADWMAHRFSETRRFSPLGGDPLEVWLEEFGIAPERGATLMSEGRARFDELMKIL